MSFAVDNTTGKLTISHCPGVIFKVRPDTNLVFDDSAEWIFMKIEITKTISGFVVDASGQIDPDA